MVEQKFKGLDPVKQDFLTEIIQKEVDLLVKDHYIKSPHRRIWEFTRGTFGNIDEHLRRMEGLTEKELDYISESVFRDYVKQRKLSGDSNNIGLRPFVYGINISVGPDGRAKIREFGNIKPETRRGRTHLDYNERREPLADVICGDGEIRVVVELPGVTKDDIELRTIKNMLKVSVDTPERRYYKKLELPVKVDFSTAKSKYNNGVLEISLQQLDEEVCEGKRIKID